MRSFHEMLTAIWEGCYFEMMAGIKKYSGLWRCQWGTIGPYETCDFCSTLKYLLNYKVLKICIYKFHFQKFDYKFCI